jgi:hypothetical protein
MLPKSWWESKTLWINGITLIAAVLVAVSSALTPDGQPILPANIMPYVLMAITIANTVLRFLTTAPLQPVKLLIVGLLLLIGSSQAMAADVAVVLDDSKPGTFLVTIDAKGVVAVSPLRVIRPGQPTPPPPPGPVVLTDRAKAIKAEVDKIQGAADKDQQAKAIAQLYREMAKTVRTGQVADATSLASMVKLGTDMLLTKDAAKWQPTRDKLAEQWAAVVQEGGSVGDFAKLLDEAANGLDAAAPLRAIDPAMLQLILEIIKIVMALLNK